MWQLDITRGDNGYKLGWWDETDDGERIWHEEYIEDDEADELKSGENLLWRIGDYFAILGSKHDAERLRIVRVKREA